MKIGILDAQTLTGRLAEVGVSYGLMIENWLSSNSSDFKFRRYQVKESEFPAEVSECDAYIIGGSSSSTYDADQWIDQLRSFIKECDQNKTKLVGICFGHQLIADTLGGRCAKSDKGWGLGLCSYLLTELGNEFFSGTSFSLYASHRDQVETLPDRAEALAFNEHCQYAAYLIRGSAICFQAHPAFTKEYMAELIEVRKALFSKDVATKAQESLAVVPDSKGVASAVVEFLLQ